MAASYFLARLDAPGRTQSDPKRPLTNQQRLDGGGDWRSGLTPSTTIQQSSGVLCFEISETVTALPATMTDYENIDAIEKGLGVQSAKVVTAGWRTVFPTFRPVPRRDGCQHIGSRAPRRFSAFQCGAAEA